MRLAGKKEKDVIGLEPLFNLIAIIVIVCYFGIKKHISPIPVYAVALWRFVGLLYMIKISVPDWSDMAFVIRTIRYVGEAGIIALLIYQAYVLDKKRRVAVER